MRQDFGVPKNEYSKCMLKVEHPLCAATNNRRPSLKKPVGKVSWEKNSKSKKNKFFEDLCKKNRTLPLHGQTLRDFRAAFEEKTSAYFKLLKQLHDSSGFSYDSD
jgi:hypothetical protein